MKKIIAKILACLTAAMLSVSLLACNDNDRMTVHIYMPDGAPAVAMAALMDSGYSGADFTVVPAATIAAQVSSGKADMAIMPVNAAAALYNSGVDIVMLTVNTHGNLYIVGDEEIELSDLKGKRLGVIGMGNVPDLTLRILLNSANIEFTASESAVTGKVALRYAESGGELLPLLGTGAIDYALLGEPAATTAANRFGKSVALDMQVLWEQTYEREYPQACLVAKGSLIDDHRDFVNKFIAALAETDGWAAANPDKALQAIKSHVIDGAQSELAVLNAGIVDRCNIRTVAAEEQRDDCTAYFTKLTNLTVALDKPALAKVPDDEFYYKP